MKKVLSILYLLSVIAFTGVSAVPDNTQAVNYEQFITAPGFDQTALAAEYDGGCYVITFAILEKPLSLMLPSVMNPDEGLRDYNWQHDKRNDIRKSCRSNC